MQLRPHINDPAIPITRREALCRIGNGSGHGVRRPGGDLARASRSATRRLRRREALDHPARAKRVIFLFMNGGLSQVDSFDPKPMLDKYHGQPLPGGAIATERKTGELMTSPFTFKKYGQSGIEVSELLPNVGDVRRRHLLDPLDVHRHPEPRAVDADDEHRRTTRSAGRRWARGSPTASAPRTRTCPATSCSAPTCRRPSARRCGTALPAGGAPGHRSSPTSRK